MPVTKTDRSLMTTLSLLLIAVLAMGCFLFPMSDPEKSVMDLNLLGTWADKDGTEALVFLPHDKRTYTMLTMKKKEGKKWSVDDGDMGPGVYKAFITEANGDRYMNIQFIPVALTYNPTQNAKGDLEKIAGIAADVQNNKEVPEEVSKQRLAIAKKAVRANGVAPVYLIAKISIKGNQLTWQMSTPKEEKDQAIFALKSMDEVRNYILTKAKWEDAKVYTFVNQVEDGDKK